MENERIPILLIEDSPTDAFLYCEALEGAVPASFRVTIAERLDLGLEQLKAHPFEAVLLDLGLAGQPGPGHIPYSLQRAPRHTDHRLVRLDGRSSGPRGSAGRRPGLSGKGENFAGICRACRSLCHPTSALTGCPARERKPLSQPVRTCSCSLSIFGRRRAFY